MIKIVLKLIGKVFCFVGLLAFSFSAIAQNKSFNLIPHPSVLEKGKGVFVLKSNTVIIPFAVKDKGLAELFSLRIKDVTGYDLGVKGAAGNSNAIRFLKDASIKGKGAYGLNVAGKEVGIKAANAEDGFYTQDDIRELVAFGQRYFVELVPEIDVPGACFSYDCRLSGAFLYEKSTAGFIGRSMECIKNKCVVCRYDSVFVFLDKVIDEFLSR